jgi:hypothetical protein
MAAMPTPDLAVPYEAPRQVKTIAAVQPMAPKKGCFNVSMAMHVLYPPIAIESASQSRNRHRGQRAEGFTGVERALTA